MLALLAASGGVAALAVFGLTDFARYSGRRYAALDAYLFWGVVLAWPLLSAAVVIYRRNASPPVDLIRSWAWWLVMAALPWSWLLGTLLPQSWTLATSPGMRWLRHIVAWPGIDVSAAAGLLALAAWLWRTRRPPAV
jgi:hypothetical protein